MRKNFGAKPFLYPQPVMILGTYDENGKANAMNAAWGGIVGANEIIVDLSAHKTTDNIIKNKAFTVGVADLEHLVACDYVGIVSANKEALKWHASWVQNVVRQFGPYLSWALEIREVLTLVREDRVGRAASEPVMTPVVR